MTKRERERERSHTLQFFSFNGPKVAGGTSTGLFRLRSGLVLRFAFGSC